MKISEAWLREWVNPPLSTAELSTQLTMSGLEVESLEPVAGLFDHVVVAKVIQTKPHPQADRLTICEVDAGDAAILQVVCGAANVRPNLKVALAKIGAHLPGDFVIKTTKLRGELSEGMLCSASELGLTDQSEGILELAEDAPIGQDVREYLLLDDHVFDLDLTPNRADCLSVLGVARDLSALNNLSIKLLDEVKIAPSHANTLKVHLDYPEACPRYLGRMIKNIHSDAETPLWIKERLRRSGLRPIHPVVDVLNYVMLELGQPLHAFDVQQIKGDIHVRSAKNGENLELLGGQKVVLNEKVLVIADDEKALAMAGIMGGEQSAVQANTIDIWLESAYFNPLKIAGVARQFGLVTDASHRYERGVDPQLCIQALERATALLQSIVSGEVGPIVETSSAGHLPAQVIIGFDPKQVLRLTGVSVSKEQMLIILNHLGMQVQQGPENWEVTIPSYRFDLQKSVDLVEEIIRIVGYDKIPFKLENTLMQTGWIDPGEQLAHRLVTALSHRGYRETISYSFVDPQLQQVLYPNDLKKSLKNPISPELSEMRLGLWPGLLASMLHNIHRQQSAFKLCETGKIFLAENDHFIEHLVCSGLIVGEKGQYNWSETATAYDFYDLKGDLQALFQSIQQDDLHFVPGEHSALHPGKTAQLLLGTEPIGWMGALHPRILDELDVVSDVFLFEFNLASLQKQTAIRYRPISKYPQIRRDLSLLVDVDVSADDLEKVVRKCIDPKILKSFYIFDVYTGGGLAAEHKKSIAVGMVLQSEERTLVDAEVQTMMAVVINALEKAFNAVLRTAEVI